MAGNGAFPLLLGAFPLLEVLRAVPLVLLSKKRVEVLGDFS